MRKNNLVIYGIGRLAEYAAYVFQNDSSYNVIGYCLEESYLQIKPNINKEILSFENLEKKFPNNDITLFIAVGNNIIRERIFSLAKNKNYHLATYISSKSSTWNNLEVGENCFIGEGSVVQPYVKIKDNSILFGARIGHHCVIEKHCLLSGPTIGGNVCIGEYSFLGLNSVVQQNIKIGSKNIIGMGVAIKTPTEDKSVFSAKNPTKRMVSFDDISNKYLS
jgi:sugar O-acyltransferase (sialic acid O-acetyltransferase NeuD family)